MIKLLRKIYTKGFAGCLIVLRCKLLKYINIVLDYIYSLSPINEYSIVLESEGDCCDNAYALYDYMKNNDYFSKYDVTWLVENPKSFIQSDYVKYVQKNFYYFFSPRTVKALKTCRWYIYDHCNMMALLKRRDGQLIECIWHGSPFKGSTADECIDDYMDEAYSLSPFFAKNTASFINCSENKVSVLGYPRNDYFFKDKDYRNQFFESLKIKKDCKLILWMPTFRGCHNDTLSTESLKNTTGLPILYSEKYLQRFDNFLRLHNFKVLLKVHHLQSNLPIYQRHFNNIIVLKDENICNLGLQLYQVVSLSDLLITDYSSIFVDYLLLNKPMVFTFDDYEEYKAGRGFLVDNYPDYCPGHHVYNYKQFTDAIVEAIEEDPYKEIRNIIKKEMITYCDGNSSKRILDHIGIVI